jgi:hypothetical protein
MQTAEQFDKKFKFDFEVEAFEKARPDGGTGRFIGGFVSTDHMDRQSEVIIQEGLDFNPFLEKGWFNDNHDKATDSLVGYPTAAELKPYGDGLHKGWYVEGELLEGDGTSRADRLWGLAQSLKKSGGKRRLGFSVEGSIDERDDKNPKLVKKATVREVAITRCPVNTRVSLDILAKSLAVGYGGPHPSETAPEPGDAGPLTREALEGKKKKKKKKKIKKSVAIELLQRLNPKVSHALAERIVDHTARHYGDAAEMEDSDEGQARRSE